MSVHDDDDQDLEPCYRHPSELTALHCITCERPICIDCVVQAPVGIKCPDCARTPRAARAVVPVARLVRGLGAGLVVAVVLGGLLAVIYLPFLKLIAAYGIGALTGVVVRAASGGYRDPLLARGAATAAALGILALPALALLGGSANPTVIAYTVIGALVAAWGAYTRAQ